ncbi:MAG: monooxygenase, partial [Deltaproteobacteria bacterium]|nr:monooxygenase [Deltaproteobacteria bacterium]
LDVFRWGHAMVQPRVGMMESRARRDAKLPLGAVHFAHSDLSGLAIFEEAFFHGLRAADEAVAALSQGA